MPLRAGRVATLSCAVFLAVGPGEASAQSSSPLFQSTQTLTLQIRGDLRGLARDKGEKRVEHPALLRFWSGADSGSVQVDLRTRGIFRLKRCPFPPIRIDFPTKKVANTVFADQDKIKLVTHCQSDRLFERNLLKEYALYRVFNALTDTSFRVRLAHITYIDTSRADTTVRYGILVESDKEVARRLHADVVEMQRVHDMVIDANYMTLVALFQYLIGNTDWSVWGRHNIAIFSDTATHRLFALPYDYDFSGAVNAPYATPAEQLPIKTVRERIYRGYCQPDSVLARALARFRAAKDSMYAAVHAVDGLEPRDAKAILDYFDDFFTIIDNRGQADREFARGCRKLEQ